MSGSSLEGALLEAALLEVAGEESPPGSVVGWLPARELDIAIPAAVCEVDGFGALAGALVATGTALVAGWLVVEPTLAEFEGLKAGV